MTAAEQRDELWAQVQSSAYGALPVTDPTALTTLGLLVPPFLWQSFFHTGNTMPIGVALPHAPYMLFINLCPLIMSST